MLPKKAREFIKPTAEKVGKSEDFVNDLISFFWEDVRRAIVEMRGHILYIPYLGDIKIKPWKLEELIAKYEFYLQIHNKKVADGEVISFARFKIAKDVESQLAKCLRAKESLEQDKVKKLHIKQLRNGKRDKECTPSPEADSGGDNK